MGGSIEVRGGDGGYVHIDEDEPQYQFTSTTNGNYIRSVNGGANWASVTNLLSGQGQFINPTEYDDVNNRMYTSAAAGTYIRWENPQFGNEFTSVSISSATPNSVRSIKVSPYTNNRVYFGTAGGAVVRVDNAHLATPTATNITDVAMPQVNGNVVSCVNLGTNDNSIIASYSNYGIPHVWMSLNGGTAWANINGNLPDIPVRWAMFYPENNDKAIIATDMGVFETDDINGASTVWVQNTTFPSVRTSMLQYRPKDNTLLAATYGRGLWTTTIPSATPYVRFASANNYASGAGEATTASGNVCRNYKDYTLNMRIDQAPTGAANVTLSTSGGTATAGVDFDFTTNGSFTTPSTVLTFPNGSTAEQPITIRVYNDAEIEITESIVFNYTVGGGTNALAAPSSQSYTFTISDNDIAPTPLIYNGNFALGLSETSLTLQTPFRSNKPKFRIQYLFSSSELNAAGITGAGNINSMTLNVLTKNSTQPYNGFTISMGNTANTSLSSGYASAALVQVYSANYSSVAGINNFVFTTPFAWDGFSNLVVNFCFDNGTSSEFLADAVDGSTAPLGAAVRATTCSDITTTSGCTLPAAFIFDTRITTTFGASSGNPVASLLNVTKSEYVGNNGTYYFYNLQNIINSISASSANLGCVASVIFEAGTTWQTIYAGQRSQKVVDIALTSNNTATYTIGLYYTAAELAGKTPGLLKIAGTTAATLAGATASNTVISATTFTAFGTGFLFTASVTGSGKFFLVEDNATGLFTPANRPDNFVRLLQNPVSFSIPLFVNNESRSNISATLFTATGQLLQTWNLGRTDGNVLLPFSRSLVTTGMYLLRIDAGNKTQSFQLIKQ